MSRTDRSQTLADNAMRSMARFKVRPTPEHFAVWYRYHEGTDQELSRQVDHVTGRGVGPDSGIWGELYRRYVAQPAVAPAAEPATGQVAPQQVIEMSGALDRVIGDVLQQLGVAGAGMTRYDAALDDATRSLAGGGGDAATVIQSLLAETSRVRESNRALERRLNTSSEEIRTLRRNLEEVQKEAETDGLTGIANRRAFDAFLRRAAADAVEQDRPLALCMLDIDHFKRFNDTYGHPLGDQVIRLVARILNDCVREGDLPARYGGEEFALVLPNATADEAVEIADRVRATLATRTIKRRDSGEVLGGITLSAGVALFRPGEPASVLLERADSALYSAKKGGRNRVVNAEQPAG